MTSSSSSGVTANALRIGRTGASRVIFGHGLGDSPRGWADVCGFWSREIPHIQFVLPAAPMREVTLNDGMLMPAWYDLPSQETLASYDSRLHMDAVGIEEAVAMYSEHVLDPAQTVFAGFSQGAGVALYTGVSAALVSKARGRAGVPLGILALSGYLPATKSLLALADSLRKDVIANKPLGGGATGESTTTSSKKSADDQNKSGSGAGATSTTGKMEEDPSAALTPLDVLDCSHVPVLLCHGTEDTMVSFDNAVKTKNFLFEEFSIQAELAEFPGMGHEACQEEVDRVTKWLRDRFRNFGNVEDVQPSTL
ncbi:unnamed protein product [Amoebophrya sp. A120]|nr:unnamed protein product [Amoebophrya sp. A120]|eukprot:GSA120T00003316001.1